MLTVYDMWKVKSIKHQVTTGNKKRRVRDGLFTLKGEVAAHPNYTVRTYLAKCTSTYWR